MRQWSPGTWPLPVSTESTRRSYSLWRCLNPISPSATPPHPLHKANVLWHIPRGCVIFPLQKELGYLQWPRGDHVRVFQQLSLGGGLPSVLGWVCSSANEQHVLFNIWKHWVHTSAHWGNPSTLLTLNMPRDRAGTTFRVWWKKSSLHWVRGFLNRKW